VTKATLSRSVPALARTAAHGQRFFLLTPRRM
jgi:hypothetical protein